MSNRLPESSSTNRNQNDIEGRLFVPYAQENSELMPTQREEKEMPAQATYYFNWISVCDLIKNFEAGVGGWGMARHI